MTEKSNIGNCYVVFDTNSYRDLAQDEEDNVRTNMQLLVKKQETIGIKALLQPVVMIELLSHLADISDPFYENCKKAVIGAYIHCMEPDENFRLLMDFDIHLSEALFGTHSKELSRAEIKIGRVAFPVFKDSSEDNLNRVRGNFIEINKLKAQLKAGFIQDLKKSICLDDKANIDDAIKSGTLLRIIATSQVEKVLTYLDKDSSTIKANEFDDYIDKVVEKFKAPLLLYQALLKKIFDNDNKINYEKRGNTFFDFQIIFTVGNHKLNGRDIILVTSDKEMLAAGKEAGYSKNIIRLNDYLRNIDFMK